MSAVASTHGQFMGARVVVTRCPGASTAESGRLTSGREARTVQKSLVVRDDQLAAEGVVADRVPCSTSASSVTGTPGRNGPATTIPPGCSDCRSLMSHASKSTKGLRGTIPGGRRPSTRSAWPLAVKVNVKPLPICVANSCVPVVSIASRVPAFTVSGKKRSSAALSIPVGCAAMPSVLMGSTLGPSGRQQKYGRDFWCSGRTLQGSRPADQRSPRRRRTARCESPFESR